MPLSRGDRLGPYEVLSAVGAGGMGEVYRARDSKLNRDVAIKVLPAALANDADYLARFQREAQALAALHHPNIATIFGLEQNAIVMELVEGQTLRGPLPISEALPIARQIAEALEAAHEKGIIHRDLKPGNIIVTPEGIVKVLDFGLAKAVEKSGSTNPTDSPTLSMRATEAGLILGTAGYMSPEQAAAKPVDRRADIWSFGVVLHELITGQRLFQGETVSHTLADVLRADIDFNPIPQGPIRELLRRCLDRNLKTRLRDIGEARIAIESYLANPIPTTPTVQPGPTNRWPWVVAAVLFLAALAGWGAFFRKPNLPALVTKFDVNPPESTSFGYDGNAGGAAISPDGRVLAFGAIDAKGISSLYLRSLDSLNARALPGTEGASGPFWSPDSKALAFMAGGKLKRIDLVGGSPIALCDIRMMRGGAWNDDGVILFAEQLSGLQTIPASGGTPTPVTRLNTNDGESAHYYPTFLPGGKKFLYLARNLQAGNMGVYIGSLDGKPAIRIANTQHKAVFDPVAGRLLYVQKDGALVSRRLELDPPRMIGDLAIVSERIGLNTLNGFADFAISGNGTLIYSPGRFMDKVRLGWRDRSGNLLGTIGQPLERPGILHLSPDGGRVVYGAGFSARFIWQMELTRGLTTQVTFGNSRLPSWSSDGKYIYFTNQNGIHRKSADGSGNEELIIKSPNMDRAQSESPDGKYLLFGLDDILVLALNGERKPEPYLQTKYSEASARFSPDGRWVAYTSNESGPYQVYVQGFPDRRGKWLVSHSSSGAPYWRSDGKELYWLTEENTVMAASIDLQANAVRVGQEVSLFRLPDSGQYSQFQPASDGKRFLVYEPEGGPQPERRMVVVQNWAAGLGK